MKKLCQLSCIILLMLVVAPLSSHSADAPVWEAGVRGGYSFDSTNYDSQQYDLYLRRDLPWSWKLTDGLRLGTRFEAASGLMTNRRVTEFVGAIGPDIYLDINNFVRIHGGSHLTLISERRFGNKDLGGNVQFTSHGGVNLLLDPGCTVGIRFQHMSNAHIYDSNPGINFGMLELGYRF